MANAARGEHHRTGFHQERFARVVDPDGADAAAVLDDEIGEIGVLEDLGLGLLDDRLLDRDDAVGLTGVGVRFHGGEHLALELHPHGAQPLHGVAHLVHEHTAELWIGHPEPGLDHVCIHGVRRVEEAALGPHGPDGPEVGERVRRRAGAALAGHAEAPLHREHGARARLVCRDRRGGGGTTAAHDQDVGAITLHGERLRGSCVIQLCKMAATSCGESN